MTDSAQKRSPRDALQGGRRGKTRMAAARRALRRPNLEEEAGPRFGSQARNASTQAAPVRREAQGERTADTHTHRLALLYLLSQQRKKTAARVRRVLPRVRNPRFSGRIVRCFPTSPRLRALKGRSLGGGHFFVKTDCPLRNAILRKNTFGSAGP
ncbi:hypothetical protein MRX96_001372 [Rhipicephalus microplus]